MKNLCYNEIKERGTCLNTEYLKGVNGVREITMFISFCHIRRKMREQLENALVGIEKYLLKGFDIIIKTTKDGSVKVAYFKPKGVVNGQFKKKTDG